MNNVLKHNRAACQNVRFAIVRDNGCFNITLADDGRGFDLKNCARGHGLRNMEERAAAIGGELEIHSAPGCGTTIQFRGTLEPAPAWKPPAFASFRNGTGVN